MPVIDDGNGAAANAKMGKFIMSKPLANQIALVTGASRGLGRASARRFAADGAHVIVHYANSANAADELVDDIKAAGGSAETLQADLSTPEGIDKLVADTKALLGDRKLDILFNNAGVLEFASFEETTADIIDRQHAVNVRAPFLTTTGLLDTLADDARVLFTSSLVSREAFDGIPAYSITKGAVDTLVINLAQQLGPRGIRVNAVAPGAIETDMAEFLQDPDSRAGVQSMQALQRIGQPEDIANVAAFLAGPDSNWVTGQIIGADGGSKL